MHRADGGTTTEHRQLSLLRCRLGVLLGVMGAQHGCVWGWCMQLMGPRQLRAVRVYRGCFAASAARWACSEAACTCAVCASRQRLQSWVVQCDVLPGLGFSLSVFAWKVRV